MMPLINFRPFVCHVQSTPSSQLSKIRKMVPITPALRKPCTILKITPRTTFDEKIFYRVTTFPDFLWDPIRPIGLYRILKHLQEQTPNDCTASPKHLFLGLQRLRGGSKRHSQQSLVVVRHPTPPPTPSCSTV